MKTVKSKLRRRDGSLVDITAKVTPLSTVTQADRDKAVAERFEKRQQAQAGKQQAPVKSDK